ncbi:MAG: sugar ABC transporter permease [Epulopiscium sp.]|nr:sugar ABC transporter permease [Candidatus Epulonipiscium sp.]
MEELNLSSTTVLARDQKRKPNFKERFKTLLTDIYKTRYLQLLALPGLIYFIIFQYIPMYGVIMAFQNYKIRDGILGSKWVWFDNFIKFVQHPFFWRLVRNTLVINVYQLIFVFPIPIIFALLLNEVRNRHYKKVVQTVSYLPHFISLPAIIGMMVMFLSPTGGAVNRLIETLGGTPIYFFAESGWFRSLYILSDIWTTTGWSAIIYIAALAGVNSELYESAAIDGANRWRQMWHVSVPAIAPTIIIMLLLSIGKMMSLGSEKVLLMQTPLTFETSDVISTFVYRRGLEYAEYSFSAAVSVFNSVINIILLFIANHITRKVSETSLW